MVLVERDLSILKYLLDMKFADVELIGGHFFDLVGCNFSATRNRLKALESEGYIVGQKGLIGSHRKYYFATMKSYRLVKNEFLESVVVKPINVGFFGFF